VMESIDTVLGADSGTSESKGERAGKDETDASGHDHDGDEGYKTNEDESFVAPRPDSCPFCRGRLDSQMDALGDADDLFRGHTVKRVPLLADEVRGEELLNVVAACLA